MHADKKVHFGWFIRHERKRRHISQRGLAAQAGITDRRLSDIEQMEKPEISDETYTAIAIALGYPTAEQFDEHWKTTPVEEPRFKDPGAVIRLSEFENKVDLLAAASKAWDERQVKKAAKSPGKS